MIFDVSFDQKLLSYSFDTVIQVLSLPKLNKLNKWSDRYGTTKVKFLPNNNIVEYGGEVIIYDQQGTQIYTENMNGATYTFGISPSESNFYISDFRGNLFIKTLRGKTQKVIDEPSTIFNAVLDKEEKYMVTGDDKGVLHIYNLQQYNPCFFNY